MGVARRLYLYLAAGISLAVMASGAYLLLALILRQAASGFGGRVLSGGSARSDLSLAIALVLVALPLWALHWYLATRGTAEPTELGLQERRSAIRSLYFALVSLVSLLAVVSAGIQLLNAIVPALIGVSDASATDALSRLAAVIVAGGVWGYHFWVRGDELRLTQLSGVAAWLPRLYRYGASWIGLGMLVVGTSGVIAVLLDALVGGPTLRGDNFWWRSDLVTPMSSLAAGSLVWLAHWSDGERAARDAHLIGEDERRSRLRAAYFGGVILVATAAVVVACFAVLDEVGGWILGSDGAPDPRGAAEAILGPLLAVVPFALAGWLHLRRQVAELTPVDTAAVRSARRIAAHLVAGVGLVMLAGGAFQLLDTILHVVVGGPGIGQIRTDSRLPSGIAAAVVGAAAWLPAWGWVLRRRAGQPHVELRAAASRGYLYLAIAAALISFVPAAALIVFRTIDTILGASGSGLGSAVATPLAVSLVALAVAGYHTALLRQEQAVSRESAPEPATVMPDTLSGVVAEESVSLADALPPPRVRVPLWLDRPAHTDLAMVVDALRAALPPEATLEVGHDATSGSDN